MFSATKIVKIDKLLPKSLILGSNEEFKTVDTTVNFAKTVENLEQSFYLVPSNLKEAYLLYILK